MKIILAFLAGILCISECKSQNNSVVIELFTSQGCSSCPDADRNLTEILQRAKKEGREVYGLSFHVDYWNYIGWKDPYSSKEFTERQRKYSGEMNLRSVYTPQMIVNGKDEFVGSNRSESEKVIERAFGQKSAYQITVKNLLVVNGVASFRYSLDKEPSGEVINIALIEKEVENDVPRGENSGRKLHHDNVVRSFVTKPAKREEEMRIQVPKIDGIKASVVFYIQNKDLLVIGATSKALN